MLNQKDREANLRKTLELAGITDRQYVEMCIRLSRQEKNNLLGLLMAKDLDIYREALQRQVRNWVCNPIPGTSPLTKQQYKYL